MVSLSNHFGAADNTIAARRTWYGALYDQQIFLLVYRQKLMVFRCGPAAAHMAAHSLSLMQVAAVAAVGAVAGD
jgi:hypothetical protein